MTPQETKIRILSDEALSTHMLGKALDARGWYCTRSEGGSMYAFRVTLLPQHVIVTGDLGALVIQHADDGDPIDWLRRAVDSTNYLASKVVAGRAKRPSIDAFVEWAQGEIGNCDTISRLTTLQTAVRCAKSGEYELIELLRMTQDAWVDDPPRCEEYDPEFLWIRDALRKFLVLLDK